MPTPRSVFHSTIAFDLGGRCTGLFLVNHKQGEKPQAQHAYAATLVLPQEDDQFKYSTRNRTAVRHRVRSAKRFKLARRLVAQVIGALTEKKGDEIDAIENRRRAQAVSSLLRKRGFTRMEGDTEVDLSVLETIEPALFAEHPDLGRFFQANRSILQQWDELSQQAETVSELGKILPTAREFSVYVKSEFPELDAKKKELEKAIKALSEDVKSIDQQLNLGHKHRQEYFQDIHNDMQTDSRLKPIFELFGSEDRFWCFICNVSNLQLRALRWYFDEPNPLLASKWNPEKFQRVWVRALKYFHPTKDRRGDWLRLIEEVSSSANVLDTICRILPERTIPPYEDQNNRHPPVDQTLWLNPLRLNQRYESRWRIWSQKLERADQDLSEKLEEILEYTDRRSRVRFAEQNPLAREVYFDSYVLQRALDRNTKIDNFSIRVLATRRPSQKLQESRDRLAKVIGVQHVDEFLEFAADYYGEVEAAKNGLWVAAPQSLLERADIHPPMKAKVLDLLIGNLFDADEQTGRKIREELWFSSIPNAKRRTLKSICGSIETIRKAFGGEFRYRYDEFVRNYSRSLDDRFKPKSTDEKSLGAVREGVEIARGFLNKQLHLSEQQLQRIVSPYVYAQLYTLIETERNGFTSTTLAAHMENRWRMNSVRDGLAQCSRLPADSVRPFDGVLRKSLDRQAFEAAKLAAEKLTKQNSLHDTRIHFSIIVESNKFAFSASIADLKKNNSTRKKAEEALKHQQKIWLDKDQRIIIASRNICAYTGKAIDPETPESYEFDHIIPRSFTTASMGTVFNSEANLICVSRSGNQAKSNQRYDLERLHPRYLQAVFDCTDIQEIERSIECTVKGLVASRRIRYFDLLSDKEQDAVRHALFLEDASEARRSVLRELAAMNRTRVNGTQAWFIRSFTEKLSDLLQPWLQQNGNTLDVRCWKADAEQTSRLRKQLGAVLPEFIKTQPQSVASHTVDAMCAYAAICGNPDACDFTGAEENFADGETFVHGESLSGLHPREVRLINICARNAEAKSRHDERPIFKEGIYAEHFLPLILCKDRLYVGYTVPKEDGSGGNAVRVSGKAPRGLLEELAPCLDKEVRSFSDHPYTYKIVKEKAYALLNKSSLYPSKLSMQERRCAEILRKLLYCTQRIPIAEWFCPDGNKFVQQTEAIKDKSFQIKVNVGGARENYSANGVVILPAKCDWLALVQDDELADKWGKTITDFDLDSWLSKKVRMNSSRLQHAAHKRTASLPICEQPSGGFRIQRRNADGSAIHQVHAISNMKYRGFQSNVDGKVNWKNSVLFPYLAHEKLTPLGAEITRSDFIVPMSEWREVEHRDTVKVEVSPATDSRRYVRVQLPFELLRTWLLAAKVESVPENPMRFPREIKLPNPKGFAEAAKDVVTVFAQPRDKIVFEQLGSTVIVKFQATNGPAEMNAAYNRAVRL